MSNDFQQLVGSAVQAALAESLPQELAGPQLAAALEASLGSQLQQSLAQPLQDSFTAAFQHQLMPAFEGACRDMFAQVGRFQRGKEQAVPMGDHSVRLCMQIAQGC